MAAKDRNLVDQAYQQFDALKKVITADPAMIKFLTAPQVVDHHKEELIKTVFGPRMEKLFVEFLFVLMEKHRIGFLPQIIDAFERLVEIEKGMVRARVITAVAMSDSEEHGAITQLESRTGKKVILEKKVDPSILGGMITIIDDEIIDGSVRHGLKVIEAQLAKVKVA